MQYEYGYAYLDYPVDDFMFPSGSRLAVHNLMDGMPGWMREADLVFCDPPWNEGNLRSFYTKNGDDLIETYEMFMSAVFGAIREINPTTAYVEIGKQYLADYIMRMRNLYRYVTFYNSTYYRSADKLCYVVRGSCKAAKPRLDGMDEEDIIRWVCEHEDYSCIADPCMGQGLVALYASKAGKRFVGTDINPKRLAVARRRVEHGTKTTA